MSNYFVIMGFQDYVWIRECFQVYAHIYERIVGSGIKIFIMECFVISEKTAFFPFLVIFERGV